MPEHFLDLPKCGFTGILQDHGDMMPNCMEAKLLDPCHFTQSRIISEFVRDIKVNFTPYYNKRHKRRGYFWGDRFKSVIVDKGETLVNCLAYIDLNPLRAGISNRPEEYRWSSIGYHMQADNKDKFLSTDFGLQEFNVNEKIPKPIQGLSGIYSMKRLSELI